MKTTPDGCIKYTLSAASVAQLVELAVPLGYTGPRNKRAAVTGFLAARGYGCVHASGSAGKIVLGKF